MRWLLPLALLLFSAPPLSAQEKTAPAAATPAAPTSPAPASVAPQDVVVRESLEPATGAVVGQHVVLRVDILFLNDMPRPPRVTLSEVAGLQAFRFETQGTTMSERIDGQSYIGQRFEFALFARRGGNFEIPPATITLLNRDGDVIKTIDGKAVSFDVRVPPGIDPSQPVVATRNLTLSQQWDPDPKQSYKAGDALVRTISRSAEDVPGLAMRDLTFSAPEGVRVYVDPPDINDHVDRGDLKGQRVDRVTYVFERGGHFELPAVVQPWWELGSGKVKTAQADGVSVDVTAAATGGAPAGEAHSLSSDLARLARVAAIAALLVLAAIGAARLSRNWRESPAYAEQEAFNDLRNACAGGEAQAVYSALAAWRRHLRPEQADRAQEAAASLDAALFSGPTKAWTADQSNTFIETLEGIRRTQSHPVAPSKLPPLNPQVSPLASV
ncbi:MAG: BatD family protein [Hyphomicrobiaceae bacterium]